MFPVYNNFLEPLRPHRLATYMETLRVNANATQIHVHIRSIFPAYDDYEGPVRAEGLAIHINSLDAESVELCHESECDYCSKQRKDQQDVVSRGSSIHPRVLVCACVHEKSTRRKESRARAQNRHVGEGSRGVCIHTLIVPQQESLP
jgi:hypothetical protein